MSQVTEPSERFQTALASIKLIQASAVLDLTEDDFDFLTSNKVWIATDRSRARRCVEAGVYGTLDFVGLPRFPAPVEFFFSSRRRHTRSDRDWRSEEHTSELQSRSDLVCRIILGSEEHTSELQSRSDLVCRLLLEKKRTTAKAGTAHTSKDHTVR